MTHRAFGLAPRLGAAAALVCLFAMPGRPQTAPDLSKQIHDSVEAWRVRTHLPAGLAVSASLRGQTVFSEGFGTMRLGSNAPVTLRTVFHMASISKPFVATGVMQLVDQGKVDIDQPVSRYLPYFRMRDPRRGIDHGQAGAQSQVRDT
jgi:CubicO group peptidase (beta-lactamase class C family)